MRCESIKFLLVVIALLVIDPVASPTLADEAASLPVDFLAAPSGFDVEVYAEVPGARSMAVVDELKTVFVGTTGDKVYAVVDRDQDAIVDEVIEVANGLRRPSAVAYKDSYLFIVAEDRIVRYVVEKVGANEKYRGLVIKYDLPASGPYGTRSATIGPDNKLYVGISAPCNLCEVTGEEATILRMNVDGSETEIYAYGVRSAGGMDFERETGALFFTDNGVDGMGDDTPPDELNHAPFAGLNFGFPWYAGASVTSPGYDGATVPDGVQFPVVRIAPHASPQGIHFYRGKMFPREYRGNLFIAEHGSWDRSEPVGYRVMRVKFDEGRPTSAKLFAYGWLNGGEAWGRPVDIEELGDGSLLISDDHAGKIYRVSYTGS